MTILLLTYMLMYVTMYVYICHVMRREIETGMVKLRGNRWMIAGFAFIIPVFAPFIILMGITCAVFEDVWRPVNKYDDAV